LSPSKGGPLALQPSSDSHDPKRRYTPHRPGAIFVARHYDSKRAFSTVERLAVALVGQQNHALAESRVERSLS